MHLKIEWMWDFLWITQTKQHFFLIFSSCLSWWWLSGLSQGWPVPKVRWFNSLTSAKCSCIFKICNCHDSVTFYFLSWVYSVSPIYRGRVYRGIGYIAVACWTPIFGAQERDIFREIAVTPWTQFAGDNFSWNLLTAIAFVPGSPETIFCEINSGLPVNVGWNTCCAMVNQARLSIDTSIVSQSRVRLIQCQCRSRLQIANVGINNSFLIKSSLVDHAVYIRHIVRT